MGLKIDLYASEGSPIGVIPHDIYGRGVGGAELAMMSWAETMASRGHQIRIYNNPRDVGNFKGVKYLPQHDFQPHERRDAFICYRSPNQHLRIINAGIKLFWSCDQFTSGNFASDIYPHVDKAVCISPYHVDYHRKRYGVENGKIGYIDLGVRLEDYKPEIERIPGRCIFCSVPDRGLEVLHFLWPRIKEEVPEATLVITSDYRLWGHPSPNNHQHRLAWLNHKDVAFLGKIERKALAREQLAASVMSYPCTYEELFCISAAECQVAGAMPVTSGIGALQTTNEFGLMLIGSPIDHDWQQLFVDSVVQGLTDDSEEMQQDRVEMQTRARDRFDWHKVCEKWESLIETGEFENEKESDHYPAGQ